VSCIQPCTPTNVWYMYIVIEANGEFVCGLCVVSNEVNISSCWCLVSVARLHHSKSEIEFSLSTCDIRTTVSRCY